MYKFLSALLIAFAISTPAHADIFGFLASHGGSEQIMDGQVYAPTQSTIAEGSMHGYPFYSGCCESNSSCYDGLWDGYCASKGCGMKGPRGRHCGGVKGGCDAGCGLGFAQGNCGKGGCGYAAPYSFGGKSGWGGHLNYRGFGGKGGCGIDATCGGKGCDPCDPCAPKHHCRLGLFDWLHFGHGHGCDVCGGAGCDVCGAGKGGFSKGGFSKGGYIEYAPTQGYDKSYYGTPTDVENESPIQPPEVLVEPTSVSDRSAWRRQLPANPFARPFSL